MNNLFVKSKNVSSSPRKMLLIAELVRNKEVISSLQKLKNAPQKASRIIYKIIHGAYKQFLNNNRNSEDLVYKNVYIDCIKIDKGVVRKKIFFRAKGRSDTVRQRKCHVTLSLLAK